MCGRTACTLNKCNISAACAYNTARGKLIKTEWLTNTQFDYVPSYNIPPSGISPVLVSSSHFDSSKTESGERVLCPMRWGLLPPYKTGSTEMSSCRAETILTTPTFCKPLKKGQRCVILADGFYEWKTNGDPTSSKTKQPYFVYLPENYKDDLIKDENSLDIIDEVIDENMPDINYSNAYEIAQLNQEICEIKDDDEICEIKDERAAKEEIEPHLEAVENRQEIVINMPEKLIEDDKNSENWWDADKGWQGPTLLAMAGIFDCSYNTKNEKVYCYSVITLAAPQSFTQIHHRMPAMLTSPEEVTEWLDYENVDLNSALSLLQPTESLAWYPVSTFVNNSRNNSSECIERLTATSSSLIASNQLKAKGLTPITKWLNPIPKRTNEESENSSIKKLKIEQEQLLK